MTPRKSAFPPRGDLDFESAVIQGSFYSSSSRSLNVETSQETRYLALKRTHKLGQCICRNINCAQEKQRLRLRWKCISLSTEFTEPWRRTLTNASVVNVKQTHVITSRAVVCFAGTRRWEGPGTAVTPEWQPLETGTSSPTCCWERCACRWSNCSRGEQARSPVHWLPADDVEYRSFSPTPFTRHQF